MNRLCHPFLVGAFADLCSKSIVDTIGYDRPAVVDAGADDIDFIASLGAVLMGLKQTALRMKCGTLHIPMAKSVFLRCPAALTDERIIDGDTAVIVQANHRASMVILTLRALSFTSISQGNVQVTLVVKHQTGTEVS